MRETRGVLEGKCALIGASRLAVGSAVKVAVVRSEDVGVAIWTPRLTRGKNQDADEHFIHTFVETGHRNLKFDFSIVEFVTMTIARRIRRLYEWRARRNCGLS
jgi:hypothetical protein